MGQRTGYMLHRFLTQTMVKAMSKHMPKKQRKSLNRDNAVAYMAEVNPEIVHTLDFLIMAEERFWARKSRQAIFLSSEEDVQRLLSAHFEADRSSAIEMPFDSFMVCPPSGLMIEGVEIPSALVTWLSFPQFCEQVVDPFCDRAGMGRPDHRYPLEYEDDRILHISYQDPYSERRMGYARSVVARTDLPDLLKSKSADEFCKRQGSFRDSALRQILDNEPHDQIIQFTLTRLITAMAIYNQATDYQYLNQGMPSQNAYIQGKNPESRPYINTLSLPVMAKKPKDSPSMHYRSWHFRQLRDERYYRGEHAQKTRGSRWSFVQDAWVGSEDPVDAYTQSTT